MKDVLGPRKSARYSVVKALAFVCAFVCMLAYWLKA